MCLLEGTNISEGRGTTRPFEVFGAPWFDQGALAAALNALELPGVQFIPTHFQPMFDKHCGKGCGGALLHVTNRSAFRSFETGLRVIEAARRLAPARFRWRTEPYEFDPRPAIDLLTGSPQFRETVERGAGLSGEIVRHDLGALDFLARREWYLLYPDRRPAVVAFVGAHNSGKTTVLVDLVPRLVAMGLTVGTLKHTSRDVEDDVPGKDSHRHAHSGGVASVLVTPGRTTARRVGAEEPLETVLSRELADCDLVLVEGFKAMAVPKIEVRRRAIAAVPMEGVALRISEEPSPDSIPTLSFEDREGILAAVLQLAGLNRGIGRR